MSELDLATRIAAMIGGMVEGINPDRVYPPDDAARLIGLTGARGGKTIREIPRELLPDVAITPAGGKIGYLGSDLLNYVRSRRRTA
jgi:hypothetical protein